MSAILKKYLPDAYKRVARMVGYCLLLSDEADNWHGLTLVLEARLDLRQRAALAWSVLRSLPPDTVVDVANAVLPERAGLPLVSLSDHIAEASFWASEANGAELEAYCLAAFRAMAPGRQAAFLDHVQGGRAA